MSSCPGSGGSVFNSSPRSLGRFAVTDLHVISSVGWILTASSRLGPLYTRGIFVAHRTRVRDRVSFQFPCTLTCCSGGRMSRVTSLT